MQLVNNSNKNNNKATTRLILIFWQKFLIIAFTSGCTVAELIGNLLGKGWTDKLILIECLCDGPKHKVLGLAHKTKHWITIRIPELTSHEPAQLFLRSSKYNQGFCCL